jgi:hypothetical protein
MKKVDTKAMIQKIVDEVQKVKESPKFDSKWIKEHFNEILVDPPKGLSITISNPTHANPQALTKEDIWGKWVNRHRVSWGMIVADCQFGGGRDKKTARSKGKCPIFNDHIPYRSVTVVCREEWADEVAYWLEFVHGGESISQEKEINDLEEGKNYIAFRSDYQCW